MQASVLQASGLFDRINLARITPHRNVFRLKSFNTEKAVISVRWQSMKHSYIELEDDGVVGRTYATD